MNPEQPAVTATVEARPLAQRLGSRSEMQVSNGMILLTWLAFLIAAFILYKMTWKPILQALDKREEKIRRSLEGAEKAQQSIQAAQEEQRRLLAQTEGQARQVIEDARKSARESAQQILQQAKQEARDLLDNSQREVRAERDRAEKLLRAEAVNLAVAMADRILQTKMSDAEMRAYTARMLDELRP